MADGNASISSPGPGWHMLWSSIGSLENFELDIVGFLAVLGEGCVKANAQVASLSPLFYLPRLIPAPQALLWPTRPGSLPSGPGVVTGVTSGNVKQYTNHVASVLLDQELDRYEVRCVTITKKSQGKNVRRDKPDSWRGWASSTFHGEGKEQRKQQRQMIAEREKLQEEGRYPHGARTSGAATKYPATRHRPSTAGSATKAAPSGPPTDAPTITAKINGPLTYVTLTGFFLSTALFIMSLTWGDGMSLVATLLLSFLSTLIGFVNKWTLHLPTRPSNASQATQGDVVIRHENGSMLIVKCTEEIARELWFSTEIIAYNIRSATIYRLISLVGTLMLMLGIVALANATLQLQIAWAAAYITISSSHWVAAAMPQRMHWDLSCYALQEEGIDAGPRCANYTEALFKALLFARSAAWMHSDSTTIPRTPVWDRWLEMASAQMRAVEPQCWDDVPLIDPVKRWRGPGGGRGRVWRLPQWDAKGRFNDLFDESEKARGSDGSGGSCTPFGSTGCDAVAGASWDDEPAMGRLFGSSTF